MRSLRATRPFDPARYIEINEEFNSVELFMPLRPYTGIELDNSCKNHIVTAEFMSDIELLKKYLIDKSQHYFSSGNEELSSRCSDYNYQLRDPCITDIMSRKPGIYRIPISRFIEAHSTNAFLTSLLRKTKKKRVDFQ